MQTIVRTEQPCPMSDSLAVNVARAADTGYGSVRVWGSVGWIVTVLTAGWLVERLGFKIGFLGTAIGFVVALSLLFFVNPRQFASQMALNQPQTSLRVAASRILKDRTLLGFALALEDNVFAQVRAVQF